MLRSPLLGRAVAHLARTALATPPTAPVRLLASFPAARGLRLAASAVRGTRHLAASAAATRLESVYQRKTPVEHVLLRPGMYVGGVTPERVTTWLRGADGRLSRGEATVVPALCKVFDEILVNAADNKQRDAATARIDVSVDAAAGRITVRNDGKGIPVHMHSDEGVYVERRCYYYRSARVLLLLCCCDARPPLPRPLLLPPIPYYNPAHPPPSGTSPPWCSGT